MLKSLTTYNQIYVTHNQEKTVTQKRYPKRMAFYKFTPEPDRDNTGIYGD